MSGADSLTSGLEEGEHGWGEGAGEKVVIGIAQ
jgi:hypothetical protein